MSKLKDIQTGATVEGDYSTGKVVAASAGRIVVDWGQDEGGTQEYTWEEFDEYGYSVRGW